MPLISNDEGTGREKVEGEEERPVPRRTVGGEMAVAGDLLGVLLLQLFDLVLVVEASVLVLLAQHVHRILGLELRLLEQLAQLDQLTLAFAVRLDLQNRYIDWGTVLRGVSLVNTIDRSAST